MMNSGNLADNKCAVAGGIEDMNGQRAQFFLQCATSCLISKSKKLCLMAFATEVELLEQHRRDKGWIR
ncbi:hypothetical protein REPUB_Repub11eG0033200 [Reevesia pubescens]